MVGVFRFQRGLDHLAVLPGYSPLHLDHSAVEIYIRPFQPQQFAPPQSGGEIKVVDEDVAIIAGLAATEVEGVSSMAGNITNEIVSRLGMKNLSKGIQIEIADNEVVVDVALNIAYGYSIPEVSTKVQEKVKSAIETMTGLSVATINVRIASVDMGEN